MASIRFFEYCSEDIKIDEKRKYETNITQYYGDLNENELAIKENSLISSERSISFIILKREIKEMSTLDGLKNFVFVEEYPVIIFLEKRIIGICKTINRTMANTLKDYINTVIFGGRPHSMPVPLVSSEELLFSIDEVQDIVLKGISSKNALDINQVSGQHNHDIKGKEIYTQACQGDVKQKLCEKIYPEPIGRVKFSIKIDGLITIFRKNLTPAEIRIILEPLLKFLKRENNFQRNLSSF